MPFQMSLLVKPVGADCNLRCDYCFYLRAAELQPGASGPMADDVLAVMLEKFLAIEQPQSAISWQGGEPTTAGLDFFRRVIDLEQRFARPGQRISNSLQTNGILIDDEWASFLRQWNFLVGISIDGPSEIHEVFRGHTLDRVTAAAKTLLRNGVAVNVLTVVSAASAGRAGEVYEFLRSLGFSFLQFIPCVERDPVTHEPRDCSTTPEDFGRFMCEIFDLWKQETPGTVSVRTFEVLAAAALGVPRPLCSFGPRCADYLLIERSGDVYPCDFFAWPQWRLGNITEQSFEDLASSELRRRFAGAKMQVPEECSRCKCFELCYGGCMKDRPAYPGIGIGRSCLCEGYKMLFEHVGDYFERFAEARRAEIEAMHRPRLSQKARRNDPCPCGSGKKFKHCCGIRRNAGKSKQGQIGMKEV